MTYAPVNGLRLYYETRGSGRPLVLLHGGLLTIDLTFRPLITPFLEGEPSGGPTGAARSRIAHP